MKFCCISRLYSYRKKLYCVHVVPFFLWYQKSGHSGLEGILNWWWRNITKRKTDKHVPFPTCPFPLKSTDFVTLPDFATPTIGEEKIHYQHQACQNQATAEQIDTAFAEPTVTPLICCCFSMHRNWMYQNILHFLWFRTTFTLWNPQVFVSKTFIRHHQTAVEK